MHFPDDYFAVSTYPALPPGPASETGMKIITGGKKAKNIDSVRSRVWVMKNQKKLKMHIFEDSDLNSASKSVIFVW